MINQIWEMLRGYRFRFQSEAELQQSIGFILRQAGLCVDAEVTLGDGDRVDFMVSDCAIEVKVDGSLSSVLRQLHRYAQHDRVGSILLVTSRAQHTRLPWTLNAKPVRALHLSGSFL